MFKSRHKRAGVLGTAAFLLAFAASGLTAVTAHADTANTCADTSTTDGAISGCMAATRANEWISADPSYSMSTDPSTFWNGYRRDCSGFVSWALHINGPGLVTGDMYEANGFNDVAKDSLQQGDILDNPDAGGAGHVVLFDHWTDSTHTSYWGFENTGSGNSGYHTIPYPYWSGHGTFYPQHYNKLAASLPRGGVLGDVTGDGWPDLVAVAPNGNLLLYPSTGGTGTNTFGTPTQVGSGWTGYTIGAVGDLYGTRRAGILAITPNGTLSYYPNTGGTGTNTFGTAETVGSGWTGYKIVGLADLYGTGRTGILAITPNGALSYYPNTGGTGTNTFGTAETVGSGWNGWTVDVADINGDVSPDLLAINPAGTLYEYPNTGGTGTNTFGTPTQVGSGWTGWQAVDVGYLSGATGADLIAINSTGTLYEYPNTGRTGTNTFGTPTQIGSGWTGYTIN